jgi:Uma2 family endonuclease
MSAIAEYLVNLPPASLTEPHLYPINVLTYHRMGEMAIFNDGERTELVDARIMIMAPIGSEHADWVNRLNRFFIRIVPEEVTVSVQNPVCLDGHNEPQPDIALLRPRQSPYREAHPRAEDILLIIEVADTSLNYDSTVKVPLYARYSIPEVWVLDIRRNQLKIHRQPQLGKYQVMLCPNRNEIIVLDQLEAVAIDLGNIDL